MADKLVIVESPAKASTIGRYLGKDYKVLASYGHVRDLLSKSGSVDPSNDFQMVWGETEKSHKHITDILQAVKQSKSIFLATDPDREGEAIAWHISELISQEYGKKAPPLQRVAFHEITKSAILSAVNTPRTLDPLLVDAYLARRALDYLVGYTISPVLWQKLPGSRSAGRVQSVALRLIVEREEEIEAFISQEYWSIDGIFAQDPKAHAASSFLAHLTVFEGKKIGRLDIKTQDQVKQMIEVLEKQNYDVSSIEEKQVQRYPTPPFTTSTLQQEASRKLGFGASRTMRTAQTLYEGIRINGEFTGLITYMRTDSVVLSQEAIKHFREFIQETYGQAYLPEQPRLYKTKTKNAQEAHEAIRPTDIRRRPEDLAMFLEKDQLALYELIWKRALSSQMENAVFNQVTADVASASREHVFRAVGTTQIFDGFLRLYQEGTDEVVEEKEKKKDKEDMKLPLLKKSDKLSLKKLENDQHFTQPPPHFTEASLVKKLEELGIGRPSTYASLIQVLQDRGYAVLDRRQFEPSDRGRIVTAFLTSFCRKYLEYDFTAHLEDELDDISNGKLEWKSVMRNFWTEFSKAVDQMKSLSTEEVMHVLEEHLSSYLFKNLQDRRCDKCGKGEMGLRLGKFGAFLGCDQYPECMNRKNIGLNEGDSGFEAIDLGTDPQDGSKVSLRRGPYGFYVQFEQDPPAEFVPEENPAEKKKGRKSKKASKNLGIKRVGLSPGMDPLSFTLKDALLLKSFPKELGQIEGEAVLLNTGRFGPYVKCGEILASIPKNINFADISLEQAVSLIELKRKKKAESKDGSRKKTANSTRKAVSTSTKTTKSTRSLAKRTTTQKKTAKKTAAKKTAAKKTAAKKTAAKKTTV